MARKSPSLARLEAELRDHALGFPETREDFPWGERALKVRDKVFVFMRLGDGRLGFSVKLPFTRDEAMAEAGATPTGYGLGKAGWVTFAYEAGDDPPVDRIKRWIGESYRAVAPRKLVEMLDGPKPKAPKRRR